MSFFISICIYLNPLIFLMYYWLIINKSKFLCLKTGLFTLFIQIPLIFNLNYILLLKTKLLSYIVQIWFSLPFLKLKYKHKIYNIKFLSSSYNQIFITKLFTHALFFFLKNTYIIKFKKFSAYNSFLIFFINFKLFNLFKQKILKFLNWNIFSQRGFRLNRASIQVKPGKVSSFKAFKSKVF